MEISTENTFKWVVNDTHTRLSQTIPIIYLKDVNSGDLDNLLNGNNGDSTNCIIRINADDVVSYGYCSVKLIESIHSKKNFELSLFEDEECTIPKDIKFTKTFPLKSKYIIDSNYIDFSHSRNIVANRLWKEMSINRSIDYYSIDGFPCRLYIEDEYFGLITLNLPLDGELFGLNCEGNDGLIEGTDYATSSFLNIPSIQENGWKDLLREDIAEDELHKLKSIAEFIQGADDDQFKEYLSYHFDIDSLIDYFIFITVICGVDNFAKNQIFFSRDNMMHWIASVHDLDSTFGLNHDGTGFCDPDCSYPQGYTLYNTWHLGNILYDKLIRNYEEDIVERYIYLRDNVLSYSNIMNYFEEFIHDVKPYYDELSELFEEIPSSNLNNINQIRDWLKLRLKYCDGLFVIGVLNETTPAEEPIQHTVTFNLDNGEVDIVYTINEGDTLDELPSDPIKEGFEFEDWYHDVEGVQTIFDLDVVVNQDIVVYAVYVETVPEVQESDQPEDLEYVDLGLPSGTLWATRNVGAETPGDMGNYFIWGDPQPMTDPFLSYYSDIHDVVDILPLERDPSYVNRGNEWRTPTGEEIDELIQYTVKHPKNDELGHGILMTSTVNEKSIFLPFDRTGVYGPNTMLKTAMYMSSNRSSTINGIDSLLLDEVTAFSIPNACDVSYLVRPVRNI